MTPPKQDSVSPGDTVFVWGFIKSLIVRVVGDGWYSVFIPGRGCFAATRDKFTLTEQPIFKRKKKTSSRAAAEAAQKEGGK